LGRGQMEVLDQHIEKHRYNFNTYQSAFSKVRGLSLLEEPAGFFSNRWLSTLYVDPVLTNGVTKEAIIRSLERDNIECRPLWKPMHLQPVFRHCPYYLNGTADDLFLHGLCLPSGSNLADEDLERVVKGVMSTF